MAINPLANPKGVKLNCELCSKPALIFCTKCKVTYYCGVEHQNIDWEGIHEKICQYLIPLRTEISYKSGSEKERQHQKLQRIHRQKEMIDLTKTIGQKLLFESKYEYAIPAAMQALKFSVEVYSLASIELVPSYLILGEACIGLKRWPQAEEYLSQAQWTVVKTPDCSDEIKSKLHRNLGMLYAAQGDHKKALYHLGEDIYHSSCVYGTHNIHTSGGYFHMAKVFHNQNKRDVAFSLYSQLTDIWHDYLNRLVEKKTSEPTCPIGIGPAQLDEEDELMFKLNEAQAAEALLVLQTILKLREGQTTNTPIVMIHLYSTVAMLYFVQNELSLAERYCMKAIQLLKKAAGNNDEKLSKLTILSEAIKRLKDAAVANTQPPTDIPAVENTQPPTATPAVANTQPPTDIPAVENTQPPTDIPAVENTQPPTAIPAVANTQPPTDIPAVENTQPPTDIPPVENTRPPTDTPAV